MMHSAKLACLFALLSNIPAGLAQPSEVDWKYFGGAPVPGGHGMSFCFFDAKGAAQLPDSHIRVWTKCIPQDAMDAVNFNSEIGKNIIDATARKVGQYYMPPIGMVWTSISAEQAMKVTLYEETADKGYIQPTAEIYYEFICSERRMRELSISFNSGDGASKPTAWRYVPPEGNAADLLKIVCAKF